MADRSSSEILEHPNIRTCEHPNALVRWTARAGARRLRGVPLRDLGTAAVYLTPSAIVFGAFVFFPLAFTLYLSLTDWNMIRPSRAFVGLGNYARLVASPDFWRTLKQTAFYSTGTVAASMVLGLGLALLLNQRFRGRAVYRAAIFAPYVTSVAAVAILWMWIFDPQYGLLNYGLSLVGVSPKEWLNSTTWALPALMILAIWRTTGYDMVLFLAGLQNISEELYEAARIDGAGAWTLFWRVTLPLLSPTTLFLSITGVISTFQVFDSVYVMTRGGPLESTNVLVFTLYRSAFEYLEAGTASAIAVILFGIIMLLTVLQLECSRRWVHY